MKNDLASAATRFEEASSVLPDHAHTWFYLGEIRRLQGDKPAAEAAYRRCLAVNPDHGRALQAIGLVR
ncbi:MAG: tetratricopeptide repeat protein [Opitutaceae bacterium]|nr:tetratricopeptide repeat protein [Verrucomicrobiales bacterium]